jgi:hypothetical protein
VLRVVIVCECSGVVRDAFRARGHAAISVDLKPTERPGPHFEGDALEFLRKHWKEFDRMIGHPSCQYVSGSGLHWNRRRPGRAAETDKAVEFFRQLWEVPIPQKALENPVGCISTRFLPATQYIQPYNFGEDASKKTGLWLAGLPRLKPTKFVPPRLVCQCGKVHPYAAAFGKGCECGADAGSFKPRWANQTDSGQNKLGPSEQRAADRARTYPGIAAAMADQWV